MNTCTVNWFSFVDCSSYESNSRSQSLNTDFTTQLAIYQQLTSIKSKFNLSSSQEPSKRLFNLFFVLMKMKSKVTVVKEYEQWAVWTVSVFHSTFDGQPGTRE